jgi:hypothetical protein
MMRVSWAMSPTSENSAATVAATSSHQLIR